jgi:beta-lactamase regulating signal transducer with metallopeptidase domain
MIAAWMVYCIVTGLTLCVAGWGAERALYLARRPTRWAWSIAVLLTLLLPAAAFMRPEEFGSITVPLVAAPSPSPDNASGSVNITAAINSSVPPGGLSWAELDRPLSWVWGLSSALLLLALVGGAARLAALRRRCRRAQVDGRSVLVGEGVGPAVVGLWPPAVVIPDWALALTEQERRLMLAHEEAHVRARDPWLLAGGTAALIAGPWNPALWWMLRQLRRTVEMDCDARVVSAVKNPLDYGELLLRVGRRRARLPLVAVAFGEPRSLLELRIRRLSARQPRRRLLGAVLAATLAAATLVAACETPRPVSPNWEARVTADTTAAGIALRVRTVVDSMIAESMRPWIREGLARYYPDLLRTPSGPPVDVWFGHDSQLRVLGAARTAGTSDDIGSEQIQAVFSRFRPGKDAWGVADRRSLKGEVRDNVRVIWVHLSSDSSRAGAAAGGTGPYGPDQGYLRLLAREYYPAVFAHPLPHAAITLVFDAEHRVIAHASGVREPRDHWCDDVVRRLVPAFANAKWSSSGCADVGEPAEAVIVYWRSLR